MDTKRFEAILDETVEKIIDILKVKAKEYCFGDRLSNFKRAGQIMNMPPERALIGFLTKHITSSVLDMIDSLPDRNYSLALWDEKIIDIINYFILLRAMIIEREEHRKAAKYKKEKYPPIVVPEFKPLTFDPYPKI